MQILQVNDISKSIRENSIYEHISMKIYEGECYGLIGPDNAGKTSIIHTALGLMRADSGTVTWFGEKRPGTVLPAEVGYVPDDLLCFENMTGAELLDMAMKLEKGSSSIDDAEMLIDYFKINPALRLDEMDEDMNKCTYIISAFLKEPKVLVLDEPFNFLGKVSSIRLKNIIKQYVAAGNTVIILSDDCEEIMDICTRFSAIKEGKQIRRDEEFSWYVPAKLIAVHGVEKKSRDMLDNRNGIVIAKSDEDESIYLYIGKTEKLKGILSDLKCRDFSVKDLTIENQIFREFEWVQSND